MLLLEWDEDKYSWEESPSALDMFKKGQMHIFASATRDSYITFSGEDRDCNEWLLLHNPAYINQSACGIPTEYILKTIPGTYKLLVRGTMTSLSFPYSFK